MFVRTYVFISPRYMCRSGIAGSFSNSVFNFLKMFPAGTSGKEPPCQCSRQKRYKFNPWVGKIPQRWAQQPTPIFVLGKSLGQRSLAGYSPWGHKESRLNWGDLAPTAACTDFLRPVSKDAPGPPCTPLLRSRGHCFDLVALHQNLSLTLLPVLLASYVC